MTTQPRYLRSTLILLPMAALLLVSLGGCGGAQKSADTSATASADLPESAVCIVSGDKFKPTAKTPVVAYKGKTYYLCCQGCVKKFNANPEKYISGGKSKDCGDCEKGKKGAAKDKDCDDCEKGKKPATAAAAAMPASAVCPVSGKTFKPTAKTPTATHNGKTYYLCCPGCAKKFAADPAKFASK